MRLPGIRVQLIVMTVLTSTVALLLAMILLSLYDEAKSRKAVMEELATLAEIVAMNAAPALFFDDTDAVQALIGSVTKSSRILSARVVAPDGTIIATSEETTDLQQALETSIAVSEPIVIAETLLGRVELEQDLAVTLRERQTSRVIFVVAALAGLGLAILLSTVLQRLITVPIQRLVDLTDRVSKSADYSVRADITASREIVLLVDGFNEMLQQIENREAALRQAQAGLEERVRDRTLALEVQVAERVHAEKELLRYSSELLASNRDLEDFAYVASHDLQEPLRKIEAFGSHLAKLSSGSPMDERSLDYLARMQAAASRMRVLIDDLLAFSRLSTRKGRQVNVDLNQTLAEVATELEDLVEAASGSLEVGQLPVVRAEELQVAQLFHNLIHNGLKFQVPERAPMIKVFAADGSPDEPGLCRIVVQDNGIGIAPDHREQIFGLFQRLHSRTEYEGTGIGLAICRKIAERHGGRIEVDSEPGEGTSFSVYLPIAGAATGSSGTFSAIMKDRDRGFVK